MESRFSIRHMFEAITLGAVVLAIGKVADDYSGDWEVGAWPTILLTGSLDGAYVGVRRLVGRDLAICGFKSMLVDFMLTALAGLPHFLNRIVLAPRPAWLTNWDPLGEAKVAIVVVALGGITAGLLSLPPGAMVLHAKRRASGENWC